MKKKQRKTKLRIIKETKGMPRECKESESKKENGEGATSLPIFCSVNYFNRVVDNGLAMSWIETYRISFDKIKIEIKLWGYFCNFPNFHS